MGGKRYENKLLSVWRQQNNISTEWITTIFSTVSFEVLVKSRTDNFMSAGFADFNLRSCGNNQNTKTSPFCRHWTVNRLCCLFSRKSLHLCSNLIKPELRFSVCYVLSLLSFIIFTNSFKLFLLLTQIQWLNKDLLYFSNPDRSFLNNNILFWAQLLGAVFFFFAMFHSSVLMFAKRVKKKKIIDVLG